MAGEAGPLGVTNLCARAIPRSLSLSLSLSLYVCVCIYACSARAIPWSLPWSLSLSLTLSRALFHFRLSLHRDSWVGMGVWVRMGVSYLPVIMYWGLEFRPKP